MVRVELAQHSSERPVQGDRSPVRDAGDEGSQYLEGGLAQGGQRPVLVNAGPEIDLSECIPTVASDDVDQESDVYSVPR